MKRAGGPWSNTVYFRASRIRRQGEAHSDTRLAPASQWGLDSPAPRGWGQATHRAERAGLQASPDRTAGATGAVAYVGLRAA